jgi:flagellar biosynthetic protein FliP
MGWALLQFAVFSLLVIALAYMSARYFGRLNLPRGHHLRLVETMPLGGNRFLCLVRFRDRWMLLGVGEGVSLLAETPAGEEEAPAPDGRDFREVLRRLISRRGQGLMVGLVLLAVAGVVGGSLAFPGVAFAQPAGAAGPGAQDGWLFPRVTVGVEPAGGPQGLTLTVQLLLLLTVLSLAPGILIMVTSFTRVVVVLSFLRSALSLQQTPPNQVLVGLALFLTVFIMAPVWQTVNREALQPYLAGQIDQTQALARAEAPLRDFMLRQTRPADLSLFLRLGGQPRPGKPEDVPLWTLIPAFAISELKTAFQMGFVLFVPFLVIDMVVASTLMSMGMLMLPPMMVSLPFKLLLFVLVDGWDLLVRSLVTSFH